MFSFPYIFTFYSFKGGVGRSLALLNTAYTLAGRGRHVLVVDMDLEAPGISGFLRRNKELAEPAAAHPKDILDLLWECVTAVRAGKRPAEILKVLPPVSTYTRPVAPGKLAPLAPRMGQLGRLDFLVADDARDYWRRFAELGFKALPQDQLIALSTALNYYFKAQRFPARPLGLEPFEPPIETPYDYVVVDSRTGITEAGGLCVGPLADRLVVLTGLNDQNVQGTLSFLKEAGIEPKVRTSRDEPWDTADTTAGDAAIQPSLGPKPTLIVASPVPAGEMELKQERLSQLAELLKIRPLQLSYNPRLGLIESIFVRDYPDEQLTFNYTRLADQMMARVQDHPSQLASRSSKLWNEDKRLVEAVECALRLAAHEPALGVVLLMQLHDALALDSDQTFGAKRRLSALLAQASGEIRPQALNNWGNALSGQAKTEQGAEADRLFEAAGQKYAEALRIKPDMHEALYNWGNALSGRAKTKQGAEADRLFEAAGQKYAEGLRIKPDKHEALSNWGNALLGQAKTKQGAEADRLFEAAGQKFGEALRIKPDLHEALSNWGNALSDQAETKQGAEADRLFEAAGQKYAEALRIKPDKHEALYNWGSALSEQGKTKQGAVADRLFEAAGQKFAEALRIKPDMLEALYNWGTVLLEQAKTNQGAEADPLFGAAGQKYAEALRIKPDMLEALSNWGNALSDQAKTRQGAEADRLFGAAGQKYAEALRIKADAHEVLNNWGKALFEQAKTKQGAEADRLFEAAEKKLLAAEQVKRGSGAYNLACLEAFRGQAAKAVGWLRQHLAADLPLSRDRLSRDDDFKSIRNEPVFREFVDSLPG